MLKFSHTFLTREQTIQAVAGACFLSDHPGSFRGTQPLSLVLTLEQELRLQRKEFSSVTEDALSVLCEEYSFSPTQPARPLEMVSLLSVVDL